MTIGTVTVAAATTAYCEEAHPPRLSWWVEGRPWTCSDPVAAVARQAALACDASGGRCRIASKPSEAERLAAITCTPKDDAWKLDAEDRTGHVLWSVSLGGDEETRARKAALWIARAESDGPQSEELAAPPAAPAPAPVSPVPAPPLPAVDPPVVATAPSPEPAGERPAPRPAAHPDPRIVMTASLGTAAQHDFASTRDLQPMGGGRFATAVHISDGVFAGAAVDGMTTPGGHGTSTFSHLGGLVALGAPYARSWVGVSAEGGVSLDIAPGSPSTVASVSPDGTVVSSGSSPSGITAHPYGKGTAVVQWPREDGIRPYLAVSYMASTDAMNRSLMVDLGLAWGMW